MMALNKKTRTLLIALVVVNLGFFYWKNLRNKNFFSSNNSQVEILVADQSIPRAASLSLDLLRWKKAGPSEVKENSFKRGEIDDSKLGDMVVLKTIEKDQEITKDSLTNKQKQNYLEEILKAGHRAMALSFKAEILKSQRVVAGKHVDISVTNHSKINNRPATKTLVCNAKVLSVDIEEGKNKDKTGNLVIEVKPSQIDSILPAEKEGNLALSLVSEKEVGKDAQGRCAEEKSKEPKIKIIRRAT